jgi:hypothetical protein
MKNKLTQLIALTSQIDNRHIQLAYFAFVMVAFLITQSPSDCGTGPK